MVNRHRPVSQCKQRAGRSANEENRPNPYYSRPNTSPTRKRGSGKQLPSLARRASVMHSAPRISWAMNNPGQPRESPRKRRCRHTRHRGPSGKDMSRDPGHEAIAAPARRRKSLAGSPVTPQGRRCRTQGVARKRLSLASGRRGPVSLEPVVHRFRGRHSRPYGLPPSSTIARAW